MAGLAGAVRFLHLAALVLAVGSFAFLCLIALPAARRAGSSARAQVSEFVHARLRLIGLSLAVVFASGLAGFVLQAALISGRPVSDVFAGETMQGVFATQYGRVLWLRLALLLALAGLLLHMMRRRDHRRALLSSAFALALFLLMTLAATGHAAAGEGAILAVQLAADALHLAAAGIWLGALLPLASLLARSRASQCEEAARMAQEAVRLFSRLGIACVATLIVTGLFNAWKLVGGFAPLLGTEYGRLLLAKLGLLLPLLGLAATNLLYLQPRMLFAQLRRNAIAEAALGAVLLILVAVLGATPPARHVQPDWPLPFRFDWEVNKSNPEKRFAILLGAGVAAFSLLPMGHALLRRRRWTLGLGLAGLSAGAALALPSLSLDAYPTTYWRPAVTYQAISVASGLHLYHQHCAVCHGVSGSGDGPAAKTLGAKPADLTAKHTGDHTAGDLFWWLSHGKPGTAMPGFARLLGEEQRWDLINFLRTVAAAEQARGMEPLLEPARLVAPDFAYRTLRGENRNLKEHRGQKAVLLVLFTWPQSQARLEQLEARHRALSAAGVEVLAVPRDARTLPAHGPGAPSLAVAIDGSEEVAETYGMFRRSLSERGMQPDPPIPPHVEFLIDRQGYIRARWIAADSEGWANTQLLLEEAAQLNAEKPSAPAPEEHVH